MQIESNNLRDNAYHDEIALLQHQARSTVPVTTASSFHWDYSETTVQVGSRVHFLRNGVPETAVLLPKSHAHLISDAVPVTSPLGSALLQRTVGSAFSAAIQMRATPFVVQAIQPLTSEELALLGATYSETTNKTGKPETLVPEILARAVPPAVLPEAVTVVPANKPVDTPTVSVKAEATLLEPIPAIIATAPIATAPVLSIADIHAKIDRDHPTLAKMQRAGLKAQASRRWNLQTLEAQKAILFIQQFCTDRGFAMEAEQLQRIQQALHL